jgi:hypothetical protein
MLLLEQYFLFGSEFCDHIIEMTEHFYDDALTADWPVYAIEDRAKIGDLMGAIHGICHSGFIGELYRRYPFPKKPELFKQKTTGYLNQDVVRDMITAYARQVRLPVVMNHRALEVDIGEYKFNRQTFQKLIKYVWGGGYPGWQDDIRPDYVLKMRAKIEGRAKGLFEAMQFL